MDVARLARVDRRGSVVVKPGSSYQPVTAQAHHATGDGGPQLHRTLGAVAITVYAVGDVLGAGIYALVGTVVAEAGSAAPISFLISALVAFLTGLTYAELSSRFPFAGGASAYCTRAFPHPLVAFVIGHHICEFNGFAGFFANGQLGLGLKVLVGPGRKSGLTEGLKRG